MEIAPRLWTGPESREELGSLGGAVVSLHDIRPSSRTRKGRVTTGTVGPVDYEPSSSGYRAEPALASGYLAELALEELEPLGLPGVFLNAV
ncbi:hypothetical protein Q3C01_44165 [Bradyrhizobium sp. UFLA05-109]